MCPPLKLRFDQYQSDIEIHNIVAKRLQKKGPIPKRNRAFCVDDDTKN